MALISLPRVGTVEQLEALLPWLNGDRFPRGRINAALGVLMTPWSFGDTELDHESRRGLRALTAAQVDRLRAEMRQLLDNTLLPLPGDPELRDISVTLSFQMLPRGPGRGKVSALKARERRGRKGNMMMVGANSFRDLVIYRFVRLLEDPKAVMLARCPAPVTGSTREKCGRWFVTAAQRRGRPATYCSASCRIRHHRRNRQ